MRKAQQLVRLIIILMVVVAGKSVWARSRSPTSSYVGSRQTHYASLVEAACHDRLTATCVRQASGMQFAPGLVGGVTRREAVVRQCLADFNRRQPGLIKAEQARTLVDLFKSDPNLASPQETRLCQHGVLMARRETQAYIAGRDSEFHASRAHQRSRDAMATNSQPSTPIAPEAGPTVVAQHQVEPTPPRTSVTSPVATPVASPVTTAVSSRDDGLGPDLILRSADDKKAVIYTRAGGQFYTVRTSWLRGKYNVDWKTVYGQPGNQNKDFVGACFIDRKVELDKARMSVKPYDRTALDGPTNSNFATDCEKRGGEFRFALQAGQTFEISATGNGQRPASLVPRPTSQDAPSPAEASAKEGSASQLSVQAPTASAGSPALALAPTVSAPVTAISSALVAEVLAVDAGQDVSVEDTAHLSPQDALPAMALTQDPGNRGPPEQTWEEWFSGWPSWVAVSLLLALLVYLIYDMRKTRVGQDAIKRAKAWRARIGLWLDERRAGSGPPTA